MTLRSLDPAGSMFAALDPRHILGCVVHVAAEVRTPGEVHHTSGRRLIIGEPDRSMSVRLARVADALDAAGFATERSQDIRLAIWIKLLGNLSFNPVAALDRLPDEPDRCRRRRARSDPRDDARRHGGVEALRLPDADDARPAHRHRASARRCAHLDAAGPRATPPARARCHRRSRDRTGRHGGIAVPTIRHVHALALARARALGIA